MFMLTDQVFILYDVFLLHLSQICWCVAARGCQDRNAGEPMKKQRKEAIVALHGLYFWPSSLYPNALTGL